jgi:hypothetical protein
MDRKLFRITTVALGLALAAVAAPMASAEPRGLGDIDPLLAAAVQKAERASITPDDRDFNRGASATESGQTASPDDRPLFRGNEALLAAPPVVPTSGSTTFQWDDASVGGATTLGFFLLLGAGFFVVRHQRRRLTTF